MGLERAAAGLWMACVLASLLSVVAVLVAGALTAVRAVAGARRRARRARARLGQMSRWCSASELAELDQALDRIAAEDRAWPVLSVKSRRQGPYS